MVLAIQVSFSASDNTLCRCAAFGAPWCAQHSTSTVRPSSAPSISTHAPEGTVSLAGSSDRPNSATQQIEHHAFGGSLLG